MLLRRVLVGTDFSTASSVAVRQAAAIARRFEAELVVANACVIPTAIPPLYRDEPELGELWEKLVCNKSAASRAKLEAITHDIRNRGTNVSQLFVEGFPDEGLLRALDEMRPDLLVLGAHANADPRRARLGRVTGAVAQCAPATVLIARPVRDPDRGYRRILVPTDFSPAAENALAAAVSLAAANARIEVAYFWAPGALLLPDWPDIDHQSRADAERLQHRLVATAERLGGDLVESYSADDLALSFTSTRATAVRGLRRRLQAEQFDLVAMGSHGYRGSRRLQFGSVARATARDANCSVLVVRPTEGTGGLSAH